MSADERLVWTTFADDELVTFEAQGSEVEVPERLFERLVHLARAYRLHQLENLDSLDGSRMNAVQCEGLQAELYFLRELVHDPATHEAIDRVLPLVVTVARNEGAELLVHGP